MKKLSQTLFFRLSAFLLFSIILLGFIAPKIVEHKGTNWQKELQGRLSLIHSSVNSMIKEKQELVFSKLGILKSQNRSYLSSGNFQPVFENLNGRYGSASVAIFDSTGRLLVWNENAISDSIFPLKVHPGEIFFFKSSLVTWLSLADTIRTEKGTYVIFFSHPVERQASLGNNRRKKYEEENFSSVLTERFNTRFHIDYSSEAELSLDGRQFSFYVMNNFKNPIAVVTFDKPERAFELNELSRFYADIQSVLVALAFLAFCYGFYGRYKSLQPVLLKVAVLGLFLAAVRYVMFFLGLPSKFISGSFTDASYFASKFGFGIVRSPLELFITIIFFLALCIRIYNETVRFIKSVPAEITTEASGSDQAGWRRLKGAFIVFLMPVLVFIYFLLLRSLGASLRSVVFDSSLRYFRDPGLLPSLPEAMMLLNILILGTALALLTVSIVFLVVRLTQASLPVSFRRYKKTVFIVWMCLFQLFGYLYDYMQKNPQGSHLIRVIFVLLTFAASYRILSTAAGSVYNYLYYTFIASFITVSLLNLYNSQLEREALKTVAIEITRTSEDWARFVVNEALMNSVRDPEAKDAFTLKNADYKSSAFVLWSRSALRRESLNSSISFLDKNGRLLGGFSTGLDGQMTPGSLPVNEFPVIFGEDITQESQANMDDESLKSASGRPAKKTEKKNTEKKNAEKMSTGGAEISQVGEILPEELQKKIITGIIPVTEDSLALGYIQASALFDPVSYRRGELPRLLRTGEGVLNKTLDFGELEIFGIQDNRLVKLHGDVAPASANINRIITSIPGGTGEAWTRLRLSGERYITYVLGERSGGHRNFTAVAMKEKNLSWSLYNFLKVFFFHSVLISLLLAVIYMLNYKAALQSVYSFRTQLLAAFLLISLLPMILLAFYNRQLTGTKNSQMIRFALSNIQKNAEEYIRNNPERAKTLPGLLEVASKDLNADFSVYVGKELFFSSRGEYFDAGVLSRLLNPAIYDRLLFRGYKEYFVKERVENFTYNSFYSKFVFNGREFIFKTDDLFNPVPLSVTAEEVDIFLFGSYSVATIIVVLLSAFMANRISSPIRSLTKATASVAGGDLDVELKTNQKGEIRALVGGFNNMVRGLKKSQLELAELEREAAWKEMARQVAHEIKNPLTPMKLAMQQLMISYRDRSPNFDAIFKKVSVTVINQIDTLNNIASEFSGFARMPKMNLEVLDIKGVVEEAADLFIEENASVTIESSGRSFNAEADKDQLKRSLINIIRNSLQADATLIQIMLSSSSGVVSVIIKDNGTGIPKEILGRVFDQNFTTKEKGMGLGLNMAKKFIESIKGRIEIIESSKEGTAVLIELPSAES